MGAKSTMLRKNMKLPIDPELLTLGHNVDGLNTESNHISARTLRL